MDRKDLALLGLLQLDASLPISTLAEKVSLSPTACWKRIQRLTKEGIIRRQVCLLDRRKLDLGVTVFVGVKTSQHNVGWLEQFTSGVRALPEVVEFYRMSGDVDYLLKVVVSDIEGFDRVYKKIIETAEIFDVSSSFSMEELKYTTALPLDNAAVGR
ncbi:Lrp/AsnC family transcriptional regulator [Alcaligenaceae bacterium]|nr:Lrp/AsnC family transcriptional regulator [Alcaligenaceae bacterium]